MVSAHEPDQQTEDSSPDSDVENSHYQSDNSDMESDPDWASGRHSESGSNPSSDPGSNAGSGSNDGGDPKFSDKDGGDFTDLFMPKKERPSSSNRSQSRPSSSSHSRSRETENQKRRHVPSLENAPNSDKLEWKKKKSDQKETPSKTNPKKESVQDKVTWQIGEEVVHKCQEEEENRDRQSWPKKPKKKESSRQKETSVSQDSS